MESAEYHIISLLKNNDKEAYKFIFRTYYTELYYIALKYVKDKEDAKDMVQTAFIKIWQNRQSLSETQPVKPYLFTILKNTCLDALKAKKMATVLLTGNENTTGIEQSFNATPEDIVLKDDLQYRFIQAISELPPRCRIIFELSRLDGLKNTEIAEKLGVSLKAVENQITIALDKLKTKLKNFLLFFLLFVLG